MQENGSKAKCEPIFKISGITNESIFYFYFSHEINLVCSVENLLNMSRLCLRADFQRAPGTVTNTFSMFPFHIRSFS